jgi:putative exosortase-associated protein (TIGR04073 family)
MILGVLCCKQTNNFMRNTLPFLAVVLVACALTGGCAGPEKKFGRGMNNMYEIVRLGEMRRTMEQTALFESPDTGYTLGLIRGLNRSLARTGIGFYEVFTAPFPSYDPVCTYYLTPNPSYPANSTPHLMEDSLFATDTNLGFGGGDVAPFLPGSRFRIFDTH